MLPHATRGERGELCGELMGAGLGKGSKGMEENEGRTDAAECFHIIQSDVEKFAADIVVASEG